MGTIENGERKSELSERLFQKRRLLKISLEELSQKTSVSTKYLRRIEEGNWDKLPSSVYIKGFLRRYARAVGTNPDDVVRRYEQELYQENKLNKIRQLAEEEVGVIRRLKDRISFSPRLLKIGSVVIILIFILGYISYQLSGVLALPKLILSFPANKEIVVNVDSITFRGQTEKGVSIFLNNQLATIHTDGRFERKVELLPGLNSFEVKAVSRFNKETIIIRRVIYNP